MRAVDSQSILAILASILLLAPGFAFAGSQSYDSPGTYSFTVPAYGTLTVQAWGGGGGGGAEYAGKMPGGTASSFGSISAGGGGSGGGERRPGAAGVPNGNPGIGGSQGGCDGVGGPGGSAPAGGAGGAGAPCFSNATSPGGFPGGGGGGSHEASGGGSGGYVTQTFSAGQLSGAITVLVGSGGAGAPGSFGKAGGSPGANGRVLVTWTIPPPVLSCYISFEKNPIKRGDSTVISWTSAQANLFYINGIGYVAGTGSARVSPGSTTDFGGYVSDASGKTVSCPATLAVTSSSGSINACPPEKILVNGKCADQCPPGFTYRNGECTFIGCPLGYVRQGDKCIFSACPAGYYKDGNNCVRNKQCTTPPHCEGNDLVNSCNGDTQACDWGCSAGVCNPVPAPSGVINANPKLLHIGYTSLISWSATNVRACTVTGTNGDSWTGSSSSGKTSKPITQQTTYYLRCDGYAGASPATIDKSVIVNIIPGWNEQ